MKLLNFSIIKLTFCFVLGILLAHYVAIDISISLWFTLGVSLILMVFWFWLKGKVSRQPFFGAISFLAMLSLGVLVYTIQDETLSKNHYTHHTFLENTDLVFKIKERLKPNIYSDKYVVNLVSLNGKTTSGKLLLNVTKDSLNKVLSVDDVIYTSAHIEVIKSPLNPHQFNYKAYLKLRQIRHQLYLKPSTIFHLSKTKTSIYGYADQFRKTVNTALIKAGFKSDVLSIINALLLGQRQDIDKGIYNNYVNSGTIHILAVSGLHIGILLLILNWLFSPLLYLKFGRILRPLIIVIILWCFAVVAGLSPSVTRAVTMFSIISIAMHLKRPTNIYNTLVISAFFILLVKPLFLFEVGFQLSYIAVLCIVSIQPKIYNLWQPTYWFPKKLWQIFTVTLAAQIGVAPLGLFYFHQFPGLFFISNIIVIPFLGLILGLGVLVIGLALANILPEFLVDSYSYIINSLNAFIAWVAQFERFLLEDIPMTLLQVIICYAIILCCVQLFKFKNFKWLVLGLISVMCFQTYYLYQKVSTQKDAFIVFNKSRFTIIGLKANKSLAIHHNIDSTEVTTSSIIKNYNVGENIKDVAFDSLQHIYEFKNKTILVIDSLGVYKNLAFKPDYILLRNSPKINLNRLINHLQPKQIIADASNYKTYVSRWKTTCKKRKLPFHYTNEKGAFILE